MAQKKLFVMTLQLAEINHLFQKPDINPLSDGYQPYSYIAGIEFISNELYANPSYEAVKLRLLLPADQITPELEIKTRAAAARYCQGRVRDVNHDIHAIRWRGLRALALAVVALFVLIGASRLIFHEDNLLRQIISEGLAIGAWVSLWVPLEMLTFKIWEHRLDIEIFTILSEMEITIASINP